MLTLDLGQVKRSISGPGKPEKRFDLEHFAEHLDNEIAPNAPKRVSVSGHDYQLGDGDVILASITSCTNTANPRNMILAGLVAKKAVELGLRKKPYVKTSFAPGSRVVSTYLAKSGLQEFLDQLGFQVAAYACSTCCGMSGPILPEYEKAIRDHDLCCAAILSGNRNFPGRIHPLAARTLPGFASAGRGLRNQRHCAHRPGNRAHRLRQQRKCSAA